MSLSRRRFVQSTAAALATASVSRVHAAAADESRRIRTVLGPVLPEKIGATLMHEHAPVVDWSELYENGAAKIDGPQRERMIGAITKQFKRLTESLPADQRPPCIVECTPIRVGRYPDLLVAVARATGVHLVACTGFWCEAFAPQHPWAMRMLLGDDRKSGDKKGIDQATALYVREIEKGMEDPSGDWGERFTDVKCGIIKVATSTYLRPLERRCHIAAAHASRETGCPITSHTTNGGGTEQAKLLIAEGAKPERVIIGHQGHQDDRQHDEAHEYHRRIADLGCHVQFDRVGGANYPVDKITRQIKQLVADGHASRILVGHDHVPFLYDRYSQSGYSDEAWKAKDADFTIVTTQLTKALRGAEVDEKVIRGILVENPRRVLAF